MWRLPNSAAAAALLFPALLVGQEPGDTIEAIPIPGITVAVLRLPLELARAPYSISVRTEDEIRRAKPGLALDEAVRGIPGVQVDNRFNHALGERISVRGAGSRAQFGVRGVRVMVDGIPATFADGQTALSHVDPALLRRIEVVRGPASALYGNTAGGVLQMFTLAPPATPFAQETGVVAGGDGLLRLHAGAGGSQGGVGYRIDLARLAYGGHRDFADAENLRLTGRFGYSGARDTLAVNLHAVDYDARNPGSLSAELLAQDRTQAFARNRAQRTGEAGRQAQVGARWARGIGGAGLELSGYAISRSVENPIPNVIIDLDRAAAGARALLRAGLAGQGLPVRFATGFDADLQRDDRQNHENVEGARGAPTLDQLERVTNLAWFGQMEAGVGPVTLLGGLRYDWFSFDADDRFITTHDPDDSGSRTMSAISPAFGIIFSPGGRVHLFANIATAFETPTTTELANRPDGSGGFSDELEPQRSISHEFGARGDIGQRVGFETAIYRIRTKDALIPFQVPGIEGRDFYRNAGSTVTRGAEVAIRWRAARWLTARTAYTYVDARFDDYSVAGEAFDGNRVPGVAPHRVDTGVMLDARGWFGAIDHLFVSSIVVDDANAHASPSYHLLDLRIGRAAEPRRGVVLTPFVGVRNLADVRYNASVTVNAFGGRYYEPGPGRTFYAGLTARIGG